MSRKLSIFTCHNLKKYQYQKPRLSQLTYQIPINIKYSIESGSPAHIGPHSGAIDYIVPSNTPVLAAADGKVTEIIKNYSTPFVFRIQGNYWSTRLFRGRMNYITLSHKQKGVEEFSFYAHLKKGSFNVQLNQTVKQGQVIAQTGWSGWMDRPHLHFVIYTKKVIDYSQETHESLTPKW
ncbi:MAG: M23 family metallopeptidase [Candidatus Beckwithbacteria bacterium]|nr:M23 family metallopeptidase [Patescibacteria group bacterium]